MRKNFFRKFFGEKYFFGKVFFEKFLEKNIFRENFFPCFFEGGGVNYWSTSGRSKIFGVVIDSQNLKNKLKLLSGSFHGRFRTIFHKISIFHRICRDKTFFKITMYDARSLWSFCSIFKGPTFYLNITRMWFNVGGQILLDPLPPYLALFFCGKKLIPPSTLWPSLREGLNFVRGGGVIFTQNFPNSRRRICILENKKHEAFTAWSNFIFIICEVGKFWVKINNFFWYWSFLVRRNSAYPKKCFLKVKQNLKIIFVAWPEIQHILKNAF